MKKNAKLTKDDLNVDETFWKDRIKALTVRYGVNVYAELVVNCRSTDPGCECPWSGVPGEPQTTPGCVAGEPAPETIRLKEVRAFPISVQRTGGDLNVYPGIIRVTIWKG